MGGVFGGAAKNPTVGRQTMTHNDILSDVDALHKTTSEPGPYLAGMTEHFEMARRIGFARGVLWQIEAITARAPLSSNTWQIWRLAGRALKMLETGKAE